MPIKMLYMAIGGAAILLFVVAIYSVQEMGWVRGGLMALLGMLWVWVAGVILSETIGRTNWSPLSGMTLIAVTILPSAERTRGSGSGVTWTCGIDTAIEDNNADCLNPAWNGGNFAATATDQFLMTNGATGEATWDVTADVQAGGDSWLIKKTAGGGNARFHAKEHPDVGGNLDFGGGGARLGAGVVEPVLETMTDEAPSGYALESNYPNPFNPVTRIRYTVPEAAQVKLVVYDVLGRQVRVLVEGILEAGTHEAVFDAATLPSGTYLYRLETPAGNFVGSMLLVK